MKIVFCGSGGSGKTTTMNDTIDHMVAHPNGRDIFPVITVLPSEARLVLKAFDVTDENQHKLSEKKKGEIQIAILENRLKQEAVNDDFISDRSILDHLAYCNYHCSFDVFEKAADMCKDALSSYDRIVFFPMDYAKYEPSRTILNDNFRSTNLMYQNQFQNLLIHYISDIWEGNSLLGTVHDKRLVVAMPFSERSTRARFVATQINELHIKDLMHHLE